MKTIPIDVAHLLPVLDQLLIDLLHSLTPQEWAAQTIAKKWKVKDVAAHLLDGNLRSLSILRDNYMGDPPNQINSYQDLVDYLNGLNADWVKAMKRISPALLVPLLTTTGKEYCAYIYSLDPFAPATFSVAWAGQITSPNWFHIAREYTEKWLHQQQIRDAVGKPALFTKELFHPFAHTFMQGLPHTYRNIAAAAGTVVEVVISSEIGGHWFLQKTEQFGWQLVEHAVVKPASVVTISPDVTWKRFSKGMSIEEALSLATITGNKDLGSVVLRMLSVMA